MRKYSIIVALFAAAASAAFASPGAEAGPAPERVSDQCPEREFAVPASSEFPALVGAERKLEFEVGRYYAPDGKRWIRLRSQYDSVFRASMDEVIATLWDFEGSHEIFSRIEATRVRSRSEDGSVAVTEQRTGIRVLGFAYVSNLAFRNVIKRDGPIATIEFEAVEVDRTTLSSHGAWTLAEGRDEKGPLTYVRYFLDSCVEPKYPAQEWIMRQFGDGDMRRLIRELYEGTLKRGKAG
jgi:hypothetical protein